MSELIKLTIQKNRRFATISLEALEDRRLSWRAKSIHIYLISRPDGWVIRYADLCARSTDGRHAVNKAVQELKATGYLAIDLTRDERGRLRGKSWVVYEVAPPETRSESPCSDSPTTVNPCTVKQQGNNNHSYKEPYGSDEPSEGSEKNPSINPKPTDPKPKGKGFSDDAKTLGRELQGLLQAAGQTAFGRDWLLTSYEAADGLLKQGIPAEDLRAAMAWAVNVWACRQSVTHFKHIERALPHWQRQRPAKPVSLDADRQRLADTIDRLLASPMLQHRLDPLEQVRTADLTRPQPWALALGSVPLNPADWLPLSEVRHGDAA